jgi:hypothetical protein
MYRAACALAAPLLLIGCAIGEPELPATDLGRVAENFFTGVFGCEPALLEDAAAENVVVSYPIFETVRGTPAIRGRKAVQEFSAGFCSRWSEPEITVHEVLRDGSRVVLVLGLQRSPAEPRLGGVGFIVSTELGRHLILPLGRSGEGRRGAGRGKHARTGRSSDQVASCR